jgi:hypothetical protein
LNLAVVIHAAGNESGDLRFVRISYYQRHAFDACQFLRGPLRVAAGDQNASLRMVAMHAADGLADFVVGGCGYGAGVENDQAGFSGGRGGRKAFRCEAGFDGGSVGLGGSAAEVFYEKTVHYVYVSWLSCESWLSRLK